MLLSPEGAITLDSPGRVCFVSHAHSDHRAGPLALASKETSFLLGLKEITFPGAKLFPAGHMLGARQLFFEGDGFTFLYTGDVSFRGGFTYPPPEFPEADVLLIEATYGTPSALFPEGEWERLAEWVHAHLSRGDGVILGCNALGKAQELIAFLNREGITPVLGPVVKKWTQAYQELGVPLEFSPPEDSAFVAVVSRRALRRELLRRLSEAYSRKFVGAMVTGLGVFFRFRWPTFLISDHADFDQLLQVVEIVNPRLVLTRYGRAQDFARELRRRGWRAEVYSKPVNKWLKSL